jgi:hypothetical protein
MKSLATVRDLRNRFRRVKRLVETEGEVLVTDRGQPKYRLTLYTAPGAVKFPPAKDYVARMKRYQSRPLGKRAARALDEENRGER